MVACQSVGPMMLAAHVPPQFLLPYSLDTGDEARVLWVRLRVKRPMSWSRAMSTTAQPVFEMALSLPPASRAELAEMLWSSLPDEPIESPLDADIRAAWLAEANRRMKEVEQGKVELIPGQDVIERLRARMQP